jgi:hypothetical protein
MMNIIDFDSSKALAGYEKETVTGRAMVNVTQRAVARLNYELHFDSESNDDSSNRTFTMRIKEVNFLGGQKEKDK